MGEVFEAINEDDLKNLALEISDYSDQISELFDKIDLKINELSNVYCGDSCNAILKKYDALHNYYNVIQNNINSYSEDFVALIRKMNDNDKDLTNLFHMYTAETLEKIKSIMD